jgi:hypothetical protein
MIESEEHLSWPEAVLLCVSLSTLLAAVTVGIWL